jgi:hypothetical protein
VTDIIGPTDDEVYSSREYKELRLAVGDDLAFGFAVEAIVSNRELDQLVERGGLDLFFTFAVRIRTTYKRRNGERKPRRRRRAPGAVAPYATPPRTSKPITAPTRAWAVSFPRT